MQEQSIQVIDERTIKINLLSGVKRGDAVVVSTHSRPKAAGRLLARGITAIGVSTHSRPKAAGAT